MERPKGITQTCCICSASLPAQTHIASCPPCQPCKLLLVPQVTEDDLEQFHASFKGGDEERAELLKYYRQFKGDMAKVWGSRAAGMWG